jgi:hypothetical protein
MSSIQGRTEVARVVGSDCHLALYATAFPVEAQGIRGRILWREHDPNV